MPVSCRNEMAEVLLKSKLPLIADESVKRLADIDDAVNCFSGINIKLMKCTGMHEAEKMIRYAKEKGLKISLGCMSESSCAISAMAQFMQFADWIDLDGPQLLKSDPFSGIKYEKGKVVLNELPGIGVFPAQYLKF
jgi:L-alanine-DL-glutamate epimerase-like enolase superfamily enzyme